MKTHLILLIVLLSSSCFAQTNFNAAEVPATTITYKVLDYNVSTATSISVYNKANVLDKQMPTVAPSNLKTIKLANPSIMCDAFITAFGQTKLQALVPENGIFFEFFVDKTGKILELFFILKKGTAITPVELEKLEKAVKTNVTFTLLPSETGNGNFFPIIRRISFQKVINRQL